VNPAALFFVITAQAGIQMSRVVCDGDDLGPRLRGDDEAAQIYDFGGTL
jgi:hypothetical protein